MDKKENKIKNKQEKAEIVTPVKLGSILKLMGESVFKPTSLRSKAKGKKKDSS